MPARDFAPTLCLDSGGVLTVLGGNQEEKHDGKSIYKASVPGAYALVQLWQHHYGEDSVAVASRVNHIPTGGRVHWVARHAESLGILPDRVHAESLGILPDRVYLVTRIEEKRRVTSQIQATVVIDDRPDALLWQARGADQAGGEAARDKPDPGDGPPYKPHDEGVKDELARRLRREEEGKEPDMEPKPEVKSEEADYDDDNDNDDDERRRRRRRSSPRRRRSRRKRRQRRDKEEDDDDLAAPASSSDWPRLEGYVVEKYTSDNPHPKLLLSAKKRAMKQEPTLDEEEEEPNRSG
eukprot:s6021_g1.t1